ncbi:unnamed protein product [Arabidopsis arenosa]|uniref:Protein kinase domain-containing protein n=1 Tax=Arabidopsis arenosa TaxID=38785 RepID=A0A8S1ZNX1_ARAAE|nr:unnamed protein product [Arabidopsis arenosa]
MVQSIPSPPPSFSLLSFIMELLEDMDLPLSFVPREMNGTAPDIDPSRLPKIPRYHQPWIQSPKGILTISLVVSGVIILIILTLSLWLFLKRKKLLEVLEDWELCDHGIDPQTSHVAGTLGYISPELSRTGKASTRSDVFALGVVMLEIACGRKPILPRASQSEMVLTDWVLECWENGDIMQVLDHKIRQEYVEEQAALVLKLGLLCSHPVATIRPNMSSVIQFLDSVAQLPHNLLEIVQAQEIHRGTETSGEAADSPESSSIAPLTFTESFASHGR